MAVEITRTPSSNGNQKIWTWSGWIKKATVGMGSGDYQQLFTANVGNSSRYTDIYFREDYFEVFGGLYSTSATSVDINVSTNRIFRDPSAFYHFVVAVDTTQSTAADRVKIYVNGVQETSLKNYQGSTVVYPGQNNNTFMNVTTAENRIGASGGSYPFKGLMSHIHFIDGTQYAASDFGESDSVSGIWKPKTAPSVTYGTNGFFLKFENSGNMDLDSSGNNLTFSTSGTLTQNVDTPSNNFATWNSVKKLTVTLSNGNTTTSGNGDNGVWGTIGDNQGKWYWETQENVNNCMVGIASEDVAQSTGRSDQTGVYGVQNGTTYAYYRNNGSSGQSSGFPQVTTSNTVCHALDLDNGKYYVGIDGVFKSLSGTTSDISAGSNATFTGLDTTKFWFPFTESRGNSAGCDANFGNGYFGTTAISSAGTNASNFGSFEYDVPAGFTAWCTKGLNE